MGKCTGGVIDAATDTFVLILELGDSSVHRSPELVKKIVTDEKIWKDIEKTLQAEGKRLAKRHQTGKKPVTSKDASLLAMRVGKTALKSAETQAKKAIEQSNDYRKVKDSLKRLECSFKNSPVGVFVDENKGWLILVASGIALGGATAMYVLKSGDFVAKHALKLAEKKLRHKFLGKVEVGAKNVKFVPSKREVDVTAFATAKWKSVSTKLDLRVAFKDDKLAKTTARGEVEVKVASGLKLRGHGQVGYQRPAESFHPGLVYDVSLGLSYDVAGPSSSLKITASAYASQNQLPQKDASPLMQQKIGGKAGVNYRVAGGRGPYKPSVSITGNIGAEQVRTYDHLNDRTSGAMTLNLGVVGRF